MGLVAIYRVLYGRDFIRESILSVLPHVDHVLVALAPRPWGTSTGVLYRGEWVPWPEKFDDTAERVEELRTRVPEAREKVVLVDDFWPSPTNQYGHLIHDIVAPRWGYPMDAVLVEPDWVFREDQAKLAFAEWCEVAATGATSAMTRQVEIWRLAPGAAWRISEREGRTTMTFLRIPGPEPVPESPMRHLEAIVHNLGFASSERTIYWKHLTALAFSQEIGDCVPWEGWYEERWRSWHPETNNKNLEPTATLENKISCATPYDVGELPELIRARCVSDCHLTA